MHAGDENPTIVVGIDNTAARSREYTPRAAWARLSADLRRRVANAMGGEPLSDD